MSSEREAASAAMQNLAKVGQAMTQNFMEFLAKQASLLPQTSPAPVAFPAQDAEKLGGLQQAYFMRHQQLWQAFVDRKPGAPAPAPLVSPDPTDRRFSAPEWAESPYYDYLRQAYLLNAEFLRQMSESVPVADGRAKDRLRYVTKQYVEAMAPSNFAATNPEFVKSALETQGESIRQGIENLIADLNKGRISMTDESAFEVGRNLATTAGSVVFQNDLIQLIQYTPLTETVHEVPVLIVPPCINKYYIMDLQPENSLVRFAIERGMTVFLVSWRNPKVEQSQATWDDYLAKGPLAALQVVREITGVDKPNTVGFCVGGTLLSSALGVAAARGQDVAASVTLLTTLLDFSDGGELGCLIDEAMVASREASIGRGGLLMGRELAQTFSSLRPNDLIWNYVVGNYLKGQKPTAFDILYWNGDSTNLPGPFFTWYLRNLYLDNSLRIPGKLDMLGVKVDMHKVGIPSYLLATREDHIVPWQSAYLARKVLGGPSTFVLGASGHVAGVINPASKNKRSYWVGGEASSADEWLAGAQEQKGSWWNHWIQWLAERAGPQIPARVALGSRQHVAIEPAPGSYVKEPA